MDNNDKDDESQAKALQHLKTSEKKAKVNAAPAEILQILALVKTLVSSDDKKSKEIADLKNAVSELKSTHKDEKIKQAKAHAELVDALKANLKITAADIAKASDEIQKSTIKLVNKKIDALTDDDSDFSKVFASIEENMNTMNTSIVYLYENLNTSDLKSNVETLSDQVSEMLESAADGYKIMSKFKDDAMKSLDKLASASIQIEEKAQATSENMTAVLEQLNKATLGLGRTAEDTVRKTNAQLSKSVDEAKNNINELGQDLYKDIKDTANTSNESVRINGVNVANQISVLINDSAQVSQSLKLSADKAAATTSILNNSIIKTEVLIKTIDVKKEEFNPLLNNGVKVLKELTEVANALSVSIADDQSGAAK